MRLVWRELCEAAWPPAEVLRWRLPSSGLPTSAPTSPQRASTQMTDLPLTLIMFIAILTLWALLLCCSGAVYAFVVLRKWWNDLAENEKRRRGFF